MVDLEFSVYDCTFYLRLYPLSDSTSRELTLTDRLRHAKALHYQEYISDDGDDELHDVSRWRAQLGTMQIMVRHTDH